MHQVLLNLCLNAIQAMPDGGELTVSAGLYAVERHRSGDELAEGSYVRIDISDTGKGIPSGLMEFIFDPFFTQNRKTGAAALGSRKSTASSSVTGERCAWPTVPAAGPLFRILAA